MRDEGQAGGEAHVSPGDRGRSWSPKQPNPVSAGRASASPGAGRAFLPHPAQPPHLPPLRCQAAGLVPWHRAGVSETQTLSSVIGHTQYDTHNPGGPDAPVTGRASLSQRKGLT